MLALSGPERRYLQAAYSASPQYAFRPRIVGQLASFADGETDQIVTALSRAGAIETTRDRNARLTEQGRSAARGFASAQPVRAVLRRPAMKVALALAALAAISLVSLVLLL